MYTARHVSGTIVPTIRSLLSLHMQSLVTYRLQRVMFVYNFCIGSLLYVKFALKSDKKASPQKLCIMITLGTSLVNTDFAVR
jgi:hypothetical protein